ncbi:extracellular solute-binding protein, partial [Paenibacillus sepulcri]|nr:extracellular solute-binding protein [Paenibacillus sepulcri]
MKKTSVITFMLLMTVMLVLSGCSNGNGNNGEGAATPPAEGAEETGDNATEGEASSRVTIKTFTAQGTNYNLDTNWFTQHVEQKFGIDFDFQVTTWDAGAAVEERKIALASGDYPELFLMIPWVDKFSASEMIQYGKQGILLPLNNLIKEHAPNLQAVLDSDQNFRAIATSPDGNIYAVPQLIECFHCQHGAKDWINNEWLKKLGLEMPTTTEEFRAVMKAFKTQDPNGNGKEDEIGQTGHTTASIIPFLMNAFIYDDNNSRMLVNGGKVSYAPIQPEWREGTAYLASIYKEGLIDPSAFTQNMEAFGQLANNADGILMGAATGLPTNLDYQKQYDVIPPLTGPSGKRFTTLGSTSTVG